MLKVRFNGRITFICLIDNMIIEPVDIASPLEAFAGIRRLEKPFIFYSGVYGKTGFSYVGADPVMEVRTVSGMTTLERGGNLYGYRDPFEAISALLSGLKSMDRGPFPFNRGIAGYFSYGLKDIIEPSIAFRRGGDRPALPECSAGYYDPVYVHSHAEERGYIVSIGGERERVGRFKELLTSWRLRNGPPASVREAAAFFTSNVTRDGYIGAIERAKGYISAGDIYQINLSQRLAAPYEGDPFLIFQRLMEKNPAPFSSFMDFGSFQVISNSPERLLKIEDGVVETCPIKGTRPRGMTPEQDLAMVEELKHSKKERAEHVMIVDLERNDLGRISLPGTVEVARFEEIETYPHLHHMVSTVRGRLKPGIDAPSALKEVFPGGSVTGAPKIRAMEIIDELETVDRSVYTGGIGWMDAGGGMDMAMAIRTAVCAGSVLYLHVGGGIVADSDPEAEYDETILKARDFLGVLGMEA
ncbi:MAG: aminodeoxychorismate synthase component I [Deltaproteobacteria bacterium]|nr:aminodeoxychorismate synthase component I [Deltaproteobacteria bacterium]